MEYVSIYQQWLYALLRDEHIIEKEVIYKNSQGNALHFLYIGSSFCSNKFYFYKVLLVIHITGLLISIWPEQEGNNLMFLSQWREFPSVPCLVGGGGTLCLLASRCC